MGLGDNELGDNGVGDNGVGDRPLGDNDTESFFRFINCFQKARGTTTFLDLEILSSYMRIYTYKDRDFCYFIY